MRMPPRLAPLIDDGIIDRVVRPLMSGKEAQVYLVEAGGELRAAKVYKESAERSFRNRASYVEGRNVRNSRDQRAMGKRSRHGRERDEESWKSTEADVIYKLSAAGVRVPKPHAFVDGVLVMECVQGPEGGPAPRLAECTLEREHAVEIYETLIQEVVRMLCADIVHGDLSAFNVLLEEDGPVVIDFPQAINAAQNGNAKKILVRDVANLSGYLMRHVPAHEVRHAHEMWALYENGELRPDAKLTGRFRLPAHEVDAENLLHQMLAIEEDEATADENAEYEFSTPRRSSPSPDKASGAGTGTGARRSDGKRPRKPKGEAPAPQVVVKGRGNPFPVAEPPADGGPAGDGGDRRKGRRRRRR